MPSHISPLRLSPPQSKYHLSTVYGKRKWKQNKRRHIIIGFYALAPTAILAGYLRCVYVYVCVDVCMYICACMCMYVCVCLSVCLSVCACVCVCLCMCVCMCVCVCICVCVCVCIHVCVHMCMLYVCEVLQ